MRSAEKRKDFWLINKSYMIDLRVNKQKSFNLLEEHALDSGVNLEEFIYII